MTEPVWSTETMGQPDNPAKGALRPLLNTSDDAERIVFQDAPWRSWRLWGGFWAALAGILSLPEVQAAAVAVLPHVIPTPYLPIASAVFGALWPVISKARDLRPVR